MNKVQIIVDSTVDVPREFLEAKGVVVAPLSLNFGGLEEFEDGVTLTTADLYKKVDEIKKLPKTRAKTPGEYQALFQKYIDLGYDVIYTGIGGKFSSSYQTGCNVASGLDNGVVEVVDSENLSSGIGLIILKAIKWRDEGLDVHEIANRMREVAKRVKSQFAIETMDYLHKGGRCSGVAKLFGTILKIKPIIAVRDGAMGVYAKPRGKMVVALDKMLEMLKEEGSNVDPDMIFVTHSMADEAAKYLLPKVKEMHPEANVMETFAGCIVSSHCGPGTIGILWISKE